MDIRTKITGIQHVGVPTDDIQKSILFYKGLGFGIVWQTINEQDGTSVVFLQLGNLIMEVYENKQASMKSGANRPHNIKCDRYRCGVFQD